MDTPEASRDRDGTPALQERGGPSRFSVSGNRTAAETGAEAGRRTGDGAEAEAGRRAEAEAEAEQPEEGPSSGGAPRGGASGPAGEVPREPRPAAVRSGWWHRHPLLREVALLLGACLVVVMLLNAFVVQPFGIPSGSMEGTLKIGDRVLVDKLAYRVSPVRRGDVVVFDGRGSFVDSDYKGSSSAAGAGGLGARIAALLGLASADDGTVFVKRVIGVGGDTVRCCDKRGRITVDGRPLSESGYLYPGDRPSDVPFSIRVPKGRLFVLGDHRSVSADSRAHLGDPGGGFVPVSRVIGRVDWVLLPIGDIHRITRPAAFAALESELRKGAARGNKG